ncbi:MAG: transketolase [Tenacibaculum sp.]|nr:transketolase [Tenacibaculum sp.]
MNNIKENKELYNNIANTIRGLSMDAILQANSGHPGLPLGMADVVSVLWTKYLKHNPTNPKWYDRDRFVLSGGHGSMLLYSLLHIYGYDLSLQDIKKFRQWGSKTPGHPENFITEGIETTTGPLGQGVANAVGMALAEVSLSARFNTENEKITDHFTYVIAGDGDLQEGISHEACSFAGHNRLGKLILFYDSNNITIDGDTNLSYSEDVVKRFESYGWHTISIDGHNTEEIEKAIEESQKNTDKPSLIICTTQIGFGSPNRAGTSSAHGAPFPEDEVKLTKKALGLPENEKFYVPNEIKEFTKQFQQKGKKLEKQWNNLFEKYQQNNTELAKKFKMCLNGEFDKETLNIPKFSAEDGALATRSASGKVLNHIAKHIPSLIGGSADLTPSNNTFPQGEESFSVTNPSGRYIHYGVREHGMGAIMNGLALHGGVFPYAGTFFVFSDYMRPAMRMAALMGIQAVYVLTHDSIGLGEDGPTHQPIAHLASFRAMPNINVLRPMDANETVVCWQIALESKTTPSCLVLTRQKLPIYDRNEYAQAENSKKGAYVLTEDKDFTSIILASGSEVELAIEAKEELNKQGKKVRVVSVPCMEIFDNQSKEYKKEVLPNNIINRVAIEAGATMSWYKYVGLQGEVIGLDKFGASAPYKTLYEKLGITKEAIINAVNKH